MQVRGVPKITALKIGIPLPIVNAQSLAMVAVSIRRPEPMRWRSIMRRLLTRWPPRFLRTPEAARFVGLSARTLEKHRSYGTGPRYRKVGGRIIYAFADLKA